MSTKDSGEALGRYYKDAVAWERRVVTVRRRLTASQAEDAFKKVGFSNRIRLPQRSGRKLFTDVRRAAAG